MNENFKFSEELTSKRIRERRKEIGYTQGFLARLSDITGSSTIFNYENGKCKFDIETLCKLSKALECDPDYLLGVIDTTQSSDLKNEALNRLSDDASWQILNASKEELFLINTLIENYMLFTAFIRTIKSTEFESIGLALEILSDIDI